MQSDTTGYGQHMAPGTRYNKNKHRTWMGRNRRWDYIGSILNVCVCVSMSVSLYVCIISMLYFCSCVCTVQCGYNWTCS